MRACCPLSYACACAGFYTKWALIVRARHGRCRWRCRGDLSPNPSSNSDAASREGGSSGRVCAYIYSSAPESCRKQGLQLHSWARRGCNSRGAAPSIPLQSDIGYGEDLDLDGDESSAGRGVILSVIACPCRLVGAKSTVSESAQAHPQIFWHTPCFSWPPLPVLFGTYNIIHTHPSVLQSSSTSPFPLAAWPLPTLRASRSFSPQALPIFRDSDRACNIFPASPTRLILTRARVRLQCRVDGWLAAAVDEAQLGLAKARPL
ncbi:hypothetical protein B0H14DRAFT_3709814 [Mycena olivaceomarginata]|nr:hypothetical protein B0H14DRAFT_3709814 [Mycena olivaceomarginata]